MSMQNSSSYADVSNNNIATSFTDTLIFSTHTSHTKFPPVAPFGPTPYRIPACNRLHQGPTQLSICADTGVSFSTQVISSTLPKIHFNWLPKHSKTNIHMVIS